MTLKQVLNLQTTTTMNDKLTSMLNAKLPGVPVRSTVTKSWRGYTLDQLRTQRVLTETMIYVETERLKNNISALQSRRQQGKSIYKKVLGALSYVDYAVLAIGVIRRVRSIASRLRSSKS